MSAKILEALRVVPLVVQQQVALELLEAARRAYQRGVSLEMEPQYAGAADLLAQQEHVYKLLARLLTEPPVARAE